MRALKIEASCVFDIIEDHTDFGRAILADTLLARPRAVSDVLSAEVRSRRGRSDSDEAALHQSQGERRLRGRFAVAEPPRNSSSIGLAITKRLAEMMDGRVGFRSVPDQGSEFWVELPLHEGEEIPESLSPAMMRPAVSLPPAKGHHLVLCIEDNPSSIVFMRDVMSTIDNADLVTVPTAELGIELARARRPELVLMDINLPGMSGLDALRALKSCDETCHIPVIALTAAASERDQKLGLEAGFHRYLSKPINLDELIEAIDSVRS